MQVLEGYLHELHVIVDSTNPYADPKALVQDLRNYVVNEVVEENLGISALHYLLCFAWCLK